VNLNLDDATLATINQPAISLSSVLSRAVDVAQFRDTLATEFFGGYDAFLREGFPMIRQEYLKRCSFIGEEVEVRRPDAVMRGCARTVNASGELVLRAPDGGIAVISLGELACGVVPSGGRTLRSSGTA
jgi:biotin-(acetyl-CoA carboxylase) ligase